MVSDDFTECFLLKQPVYNLDKFQASGSQFISFPASGGNSNIIDVFGVYALQTSLYCLVPAAVLSPLSSSSSVAQFVDHQIDIPQPISLYPWTRYNRSLSVHVVSKVTLTKKQSATGYSSLTAQP
jgi:hypothetical protein